MSNTSSQEVMYEYQLMKNSLYENKVLIAVIAALACMVICHKYSFVNNQYMNQLVLPLFMFLFVYLMIGIIAKDQIDVKELSNLIDKCMLWKKDPVVRKNAVMVDNMGDPVVNPKEVEVYDQTQFAENFANYMTELSATNESMTEEDMNKLRNISRIGVFRQSDNTRDDRMKTASKGKHIVITPMVDSAMYKSDHMGTFDVDNSAPVMKTELETRPLNKEAYDAKYGMEGCSFLDSNGSNAGCDNVAPVPGPTWMPERAAQVQRRLANNKYSANTCS
jgi:hypothetical protein